MSHDSNHNPQIIEVTDKQGRSRFYRVDLRKIYKTFEDALKNENGEDHDL
jgi:hypothetical protein